MRLSRGWLTVPVLAALAVTGCKGGGGSTPQANASHASAAASQLHALENSPKFRHDEAQAERKAAQCFTQVGGNGEMLAHPFKGPRAWVQCAAPHGTAHKVALCFLPMAEHGIATVAGVSRTKALELDLASCVAQEEAR